MDFYSTDLIDQKKIPEDDLRILRCALTAYYRENVRFAETTTNVELKAMILSEAAKTDEILRNLGFDLVKVRIKKYIPKN
jgi:hypothetical protein